MANQNPQDLVLAKVNEALQTYKGQPDTVMQLSTFVSAGALPPKGTRAYNIVMDALAQTPWQGRPDDFVNQYQQQLNPSHRYDPTTPMDPRTQNDNNNPYGPAASGAQGNAPTKGVSGSLVDGSTPPAGPGFFGGGSVATPQAATPITEYVNRLLQGARNGDAHAGNAAAGMANPSLVSDYTGDNSNPYAPAAAGAQGNPIVAGGAALANKAADALQGQASATPEPPSAAVNAALTPPNQTAASAEGGSNVPQNTPGNSVGGAATPAGGGIAVPANNSSGMNPAYAGYVEGDQNQELMAVLASMGYDPTRPGIVGQAIAKMLQPALAANSAFGSYANGGNGITGADPMSTLTGAEGIGKQFMTNGANPWQYVQNLANSASGNPAFQNMLSGISSEADQQKMLALLGQSRNYGASGLAQQYNSDMNSRSALGYSMAQQAALKAGTPAPNNYMQWVMTQPPEIQAALLGRSPK